jgi:hypothetical protein
LKVAINKHLKISEVFHVAGKILCENIFSLKAVAGLEMSDCHSQEYESGT